MREETEASFSNSDLSRDEVLRHVRERKPTLEELTPLMETFDYAAAFEAPYKLEEPGNNTSIETNHLRDYVNQLMLALKERYPELWASGRLQVIPNGEVFYALNEKALAGTFPGISNIGFYSRDGGHVRAGLPRYTLAATCFAVMFGRHPSELDATIYNDLANYRTEHINTLLGFEGSAYMHQPDLGELLEITPERKQVVDETIWEVVTTHPHTGMAGW